MIWFFIPDPDPDFLPIPDPGVKKTSDPGIGSTTLVTTGKCIPLQSKLRPAFRIRNSFRADPRLSCLFISVSDPDSLIPDPDPAF